MREDMSQYSESSDYAPAALPLENIAHCIVSGLDYSDCSNHHLLAQLVAR
jgi:hypothetical protein